MPAGGSIDLNTLFTNLGIVNGNTQSKNQYEFYNGIVWDDATITYNQKEFFDKVGQNRYEFFKTYGDERQFYADIDDTRISDFRTFYEYAGQYLAGSDPEIPATAAFTTSTQSTTPDTVITFTNTSTGTSPLTYAWDFGDGDIDVSTNPTHSYSATGSFIVTLTASNAYGVSSATTSITVNDPVVPLSISGGATSSYEDGGTTYMVHTFTSTDTMVVTGEGDIDYLIIAGGGGGSNGGNYGVGGGAGEQLEVTGYTITDGSYAVTIGAGGAAQAIGNDSSIAGIVTAQAGYRGIGIGRNTIDPTYGTFSGFSPQSTRGTVTQYGVTGFQAGLGDNNSPYFRAGGGAGANENGYDMSHATTFGKGGDGYSSSINGTPTVRGGGGGGCKNYTNTSGPGTGGGAGGGGNSGWSSPNAGGAGAANTGSGGGGALNYTGGAGGSGLVIVRYVI